MLTMKWKTDNEGHLTATWCEDARASDPPDFWYQLI